MLHVGGGPAKLDMEVWTEGSRLLRIDIPTQMLSVLRDDIASVSARLVTMARPNDEQVSHSRERLQPRRDDFQARSARLSTPAAPAGRKPAPFACRRLFWCRGRRPRIATSSSRAFRFSPSWPMRSPMPAFWSSATTNAGLGQSGGRPGIGHARGIRGRRARGLHLPDEAPGRRPEADRRSSGMAKAAGSRSPSPRASRRSLRSR